MNIILSRIFYLKHIDINDISNNVVLEQLVLYLLDQTLDIDYYYLWKIYDLINTNNLKIKDESEKKYYIDLNLLEIKYVDKGYPIYKINNINIILLMYILLLNTPESERTLESINSEDKERLKEDLKEDLKEQLQNTDALNMYYFRKNGNYHHTTLTKITSKNELINHSNSRFKQDLIDILYPS